MCGIAGLNIADSQELESFLASSCEALSHRGPDDHGVWTTNDRNLGFAHTRLSIIDLSAMGHQPMTSAGGRYTITFNGEIYNYRSLRAVLESLGYNFRGNSDTEVLLALCEHHGVSEIYSHLDGMFAFAIYDREAQVVTLARDRFGEKPLYYSFGHWGFAFSSELRPLTRLTTVSNEIDPRAKQYLFQYGYIPAPYSIYTDIRKLKAGEEITFALKPGSEPKIRSYFQVAELTDPPVSDPSTALVTLRQLLSAAVSSRFVSDVPVGAFLSGGIDSSLLCAIATQELSIHLRTFSIGFETEAFDESSVARETAAAFGTHHTEVIVDDRTMLDVLERLPSIYDEPLGDDSSIPTVLVSQLARKDVTVALSGDGSDEIFLGYRRYSALRRLAKIHHTLRPVDIGAFLPEINKISQSRSTKLKTAYDLLRSTNVSELYQRRMSLSESLSAKEFLSLPMSALPDSSIERMMTITDLQSYLPDCIFTKVDRAGMSVSLESRAPFLYLPLVSFALSLEPSLLLAQNTQKKLLRDLLQTYRPQISSRPKQGFAAPIGRWLRGPLKEWGASLLLGGELSSDEDLDVKKIQELWNTHQRGERDVAKSLWPVLMYRQWCTHDQ